MLQRCSITPYEGEKPYIFISYAHKDSHLVFPILEELDRRGYRIWYDDGIAPGSEWPENIAQHLSGCALTMAFISPNSIESANCRREVTFALSKKKAFLAIVLQPTEMSLGMEMQLSAQQCIMKYTYDTEDAFYRKVCSCSDLQPCWEQPIIPVAEPAPTPQPPAAPKPAIKKQREKLDLAKLFSAHKKWLLPVGGGLIAVAILVCCLLLIPKNDTPEVPGTTTGQKTETIQITDDLQVEKNATAIDLSGRTVTQDMISNINRLEKLETLVFSGCTFHSGALELLQLPQTLTTLSISDCTGVDSLSCISEAENLTSLTLKNCGLTDDLMPTAGASLQIADLSGNESFADLSKLSSCNKLEVLNISDTGAASLGDICVDALTEVDFTNTTISDITALAAAEKLQRVFGAFSSVKNIDALAGLSSLIVLDFTGCGIEQINASFMSLRLEELYLGFNALSDLDAFENCAVLTHADVSYNVYLDVEVLEKSAATLVSLNVSGLSAFASELYFLGQCTKLTELYMDDNDLYDLDFLENLSGLQKLSAANCSLDDIDGLANCTKLSYLCLAGNYIEDITPLSSLDPSDGLILDLNMNSITDISALPDVHYAFLGIACSYLDITTMPEISGDTVTVLYSELITQSPLNQKPFIYYNIISCPLDQQVALENLFGIDQTRCLNTEEALYKQLALDGVAYYSVLLALLDVL